MAARSLRALTASGRKWLGRASPAVWRESILSARSKAAASFCSVGILFQFRPSQEVTSSPPLKKGREQTSSLDLAAGQDEGLTQRSSGLGETGATQAIMGATSGRSTRRKALSRVPEGAQSSAHSFQPNLRGSALILILEMTLQHEVWRMEKQTGEHAHLRE